MQEFLIACISLNIWYLYIRSHVVYPNSLGLWYILNFILLLFLFQFSNMKLVFALTLGKYQFTWFSHSLHSRAHHRSSNPWQCHERIYSAIHSLATVASVEHIIWPIISLICSLWTAQHIHKITFYFGHVFLYFWAHLCKLHSRFLCATFRPPVWHKKSDQIITIYKTEMSVTFLRKHRWELKLQMLAIYI